MPGSLLREPVRASCPIAQELKVALFGALLRQDLEYLEQCHRTGLSAQGAKALL